MELPPDDVQQALQTWAHLTCTLAGVVDFLRERMAASGVRSRNDFAPYRQGAMDAVMAGGETGAVKTSVMEAHQSQRPSSYDKSRGRRLVYKLERDLFPDDINCHVCSIADMATPRLPYRTAGGETAESQPISSSSPSSGIQDGLNIMPTLVPVPSAAHTAATTAGGSHDYRGVGSLPDEVMVDMLHKYLRGQLLQLRCVSRRWDSLAVRAMSLDSSSLRAKHLPLVVPSGYNGEIELDLHESGEIKGSYKVRLLADTLVSNASVRSLNLDENIKSLDVMRVLGELLCINSSVTSLSLRCNGINNAAVKVLSEALVVNTGLTSITLEENEIDDVGTLALAEVLRTNTSINQLILSQNAVSDAGAVGLCGALRLNTALTSLDLSSNEITDQGAAALGAMLRVNTTLTSLRLGDNSLSQEDVVNMREALRENSTLTFLQLCLENDDEYEGGWYRGERRGQGTCRYEDGDVYEGMWADDVRSGQGKMIFSDGDVYEGSWENDEMHGRGVLRYEDGDVYEGTWDNGEKHGQGIYKFSNQNVFGGSFANGKIVEGLFRFADSDKEYHAVFERREDEESDDEEDDDDSRHVYWAVLRDVSAGNSVYREGLFSRGDFLDDYE